MSEQVEQVTPVTKSMHDAMVMNSFEQDFLNGATTNNKLKPKKDVIANVTRLAQHKFRRDSFTCTPLSPSIDPMMNQFENYALFKKVGVGIAKAAKAVAKGAVKVTKTVTGLAVFSPLLPFIPAMNDALKKKGVTPSKDMGKKVEQFYRYVLKGEKPGNKFESDYFIKDVAGAVKEIFQFLSGAVGKKKNNKPMTAAEQAVAPVAEAVVNKMIEDVSKETGKTPQGIVADAKKVASEITSDTSILNESTPTPTVEPAPLRKAGQRDAGQRLNRDSKAMAKNDMNKIIIAGIVAVILVLVLFLIVRR